MSRRRKVIYLAVMVAGAVALTADRCLLSNDKVGPVAAVAREAGSVPRDISVSAAETDGLRRNRNAPPPGQRNVKSMNQSDTPPIPSIPELPFPRDIEPYDGRSPIKDLFAPPAPVLERAAAGAPADKAAGGVQSPQRPGRLGAADFVARHRLSGVLIHEPVRIAIVDGVLLQVGRSLDGCLLKGISGNEARFACHDAEAVLKVTNIDAQK